MINEKDLKLYVIMGSNNTHRDPCQVLQEAIDGGITIFQYREKGTAAKTGEEEIQFGKQLRAICKANHIPFIVNDNIDLAMQLEADGLHLGQGDTPIIEGRKRLSASFSSGIWFPRYDDIAIPSRRGQVTFG